MPSLVYGTETSFIQTVGATLSALPSSSGAVSAWVSELVDNTASKYSEILIALSLPITGTPAGEKGIFVHAYGALSLSFLPTTQYGGSTLGVAGTSARLSSTPAYVLPFSGQVLGIPYTEDWGGVALSATVPISGAFGGVIPPYWGIIIRNASGVALGAGCTATYTGVT